VHFQSTPYRAIATWRKIATFGGAVTQSRLQLQMFPNGAFSINCWVHEPVTLRTPVFGVSAGLSAAAAAIDFSAGHTGTPGTATIYELFSSGTSDLSGKTFLFVPTDDGVQATYDVAVMASCGALAVPTQIVPGCFGMTTTVTNPAIAGSSLVLDSTIPAPAFFGLTVLGLSPLPTPGVPLPGAPGCFIGHSNDLGTVPMAISGGGLIGTTTIPLPCLTVFFGLTICSQSAALVPLNPLGIVLGDAWITPLGTDN